MNEINNIEKNTTLLWHCFKETESKLLKLEMLLQLLDNMVILKKNLPKKEFDKNFKQMEEKINNIVNKITDISSVKALLESVNNLLNSEVLKKMN